MTHSIPPGFDGNHFSRVFATDLVSDILNEEKFEIHEISDRIFKRILGRKISRPIEIDTERELFRQYQKGEIEARNKLVYANLRLVYTISHQFKPHKLTYNDILSEGLIGLLKAIEGFNIDSCYRFSTYAYKTIYYHIHNFLHLYSSLIVLPPSIYSLRSQYIDFLSRYFQEYLCQPTDEEVAEALKISLYQARGVRLSLTKPVSLDRLCKVLGFDFVLNDLIDDIIDSDPETIDTSLHYESLLSDLDCALSHLSIREADIIRKSFGLGCHPYSLDEIGYIYMILPEREHDRSVKKP